MPSSAREKTAAEIIMPEAKAEEKERSSFELFLTKWTGMAPKPAAKQAMTPVNVDQYIKFIWLDIEISPIDSSF